MPFSNFHPHQSPPPKVRQSLPASLSLWLALAHRDELLAQVDQLARETREFQGWLLDQGYEVVPSDANFVLFGRFPDRHATWQALLDRGVLIRETGPEGFLRASAGRPEEMAALRDALCEIHPKGP